MEARWILERMRKRGYPVERGIFVFTDESIGGEFRGKKRYHICPADDSGAIVSGGRHDNIEAAIEGALKAAGVEGGND